MADKEDYLVSYREFFEKFAATVNPEDQLPVHVASYTITEEELPGEVIYWTTQYLTEKECPIPLMTPLRRIVLEEVKEASKKQPTDYGLKESVYIALRLMQAVTAKVNEVCLRYLDNSKLDTLPPPPILREMLTTADAAKNGRRQMEDRHVQIGNLEALFGIETSKPTSFYAVYDGHAGSDAATYCAAHLHQYLVESGHFKTDLKAALREAFQRTDIEFIRKTQQTEKTNSGSTAVVLLVRGSKLYAAWAGDSQALLAKNMKLMQLVVPHKPNRDDEKQRIEASGGTVIFWGTYRVNGQLAVSRAIGDAPYKPYVTAEPDVITVDLDGNEDFVVIACDGLWDFVSEDDVALAVYYQLYSNPDDLKAVTRRLIVQAKKQHSCDNISVIVVFLKDPRDIAAENRPPMEFGLDNTVSNTPPLFNMDMEACKRQLDPTPDLGVNSVTNNGVDNSDSDSDDDLGPETAVDVDDVDVDVIKEPAAPTPPAHVVEGVEHIDGALVDNVGESGEDSEDEWNYYKGEGERETKPQNNIADESEDLPRSETPPQDNSAWETSSTDMNSSPLNPDAPAFVPGTGDILLAQSPRKPLSMDDIEVPDVTQFQTEAVIRPAEILDLDNCDQLNGHHISLDTKEENMNGNDKCSMDIGFGFTTDNLKDTAFIQDLERIQKDTTDFCNIQVFQTHTETNPFASEDNEEFLERLKNKERDPMSMSFYQEKDDDTCDRLATNEPDVDLNTVQPLPESDDEDLPENDIHEPTEKENLDPHQDLLGMEKDACEPNNDIMFDQAASEYVTNNVGHFDNVMSFTDMQEMTQNFTNMNFENSNAQEIVQQTDTPESHKLLFEQIPEIPDGKSSELGFTHDDVREQLTPSEETSQDIHMISKEEELQVIQEQPSAPELVDIQESTSPAPFSEESNIEVPAAEQITDLDSDLAPPVTEETRLITPEPMHNETDFNLQHNNVDFINQDVIINEHNVESHNIELLSAERVDLGESPVPSESPMPEDVPISCDITSESPVPIQSPIENMVPAQSPVPSESPLPLETHVPHEEPVQIESQIVIEQTELAPSPAPVDDMLIPREETPVIESPVPVEPIPVHEEVIQTKSEEPLQSQLLVESEIPVVESMEASQVEAERLIEPVSVPMSSEAPVEPAEAVPDVVAEVATPPPTPAVTSEPAFPVVETVAAAAAVGAVAAAAVGAVAAAGTKTAKKPTTPAGKTPASKLVTTPKASPASRTTPAAKKPTSTTPKTTPAARTATTPKTPVPKASPLTKPAAAPKTPPAKPAPKAPLACKPAPKPATTATRPATTASRPATSRPATATSKPATVVSRPATTTSRAAPTLSRAAPARTTAAPARTTAAPKPAVPKTTAAPRPAPAPARTISSAPRPATRPLDKKPQTNGDVKTAAKPAPRLAPRAATTATKSAPASRVGSAPMKPKEPIKRIPLASRTAAPPAAPKAASKPAPIKRPKPPAPVLTNGDAEKTPAPAAPDAGSLPDVIA